MPWPALTAAFFVLVGAWIVSGFFGTGFSLAISFIPLFLIMAVVAFVGKAGRGGGLRVGPTGRSFAMLAGFMLVCVLFAWSFSATQTSIPLDVRLFNLSIPLSIALLPLLVWILPLSERTYRRTVSVLALVLVVDVLVSLATVILVNVLRVIPPELFIVNDRYTVILFGLGGEPWLRTPGIFESGGTNGSFLLLAFTLAAAASLWSKQRWHRILFAGAALLCAGLIVLTLTRRSILAMLCVGLVLAVAGVLLRGRLLPLVGTLALIVVLPLLLILIAPTVLGSGSLVSRLAFWRENLQIVAADGPIHPLIGYGVMQSSFRYLPARQLALIDNAYLALLLYGGPLYLLSYLGYYGALLGWSVRLAARPGDDLGWLALANAGLLIGMFVIGGFSAFVHNLTEAFPYLLFVNLSARYLTDRAQIIRRGDA